MVTSATAASAVRMTAPDPSGRGHDGGAQDRPVFGVQRLVPGRAQRLVDVSRATGAGNFGDGHVHGRLDHLEGMEGTGEGHEPGAQDLMAIDQALQPGVQRRAVGHRVEPQCCLATRRGRPGRVDQGLSLLRRNLETYRIRPHVPP